MAAQQPEKPCCGTCPHWERGYWSQTVMPHSVGGSTWERKGLDTPWGECYGVPPVAPTDPAEGTTFPSTHEAARCPNHPFFQVRLCGAVEEHELIILEKAK